MTLEAFNRNRTLAHGPNVITFTLLSQCIFTSMIVDGTRTRVLSAEGQKTVVLRHEGKELISTAFNFGSRLIAAGGIDDSLTLWECTSGREVWSRKDLAGSAYEINFSNNDRFLVTAELAYQKNVDAKMLAEPEPDLFPQQRAPTPTECAIRVRDSESGRILRTLYTGDAMLALAGSQHNSNIYAMGSSPSPVIRVWDSASGQLLQKYDSPPKVQDEPLPAEQAECETRIIHFAFNGDPGRLAFAKRPEKQGLLFRPQNGGSSRPLDSFLYVWDLKHEHIRVFNTPSKCGISSIAISTNGNLIAAETIDQNIFIFDANDGRLISSIRTPLEGRHFVGRKPNALSFYPSGARLYSCTSSGSISEWDCGSGRLLKKYTGAGGRIRNIAFLNGRLRSVSGGEIPLLDPVSQSLKLENLNFSEFELFPTP